MTRVLLRGAICVLLLLAAQGAAADHWAAIIDRAAEDFGEEGREAAQFLAAHRPPRDAAIDPELVLENIDWALRVRGAFPWAESVDDHLFLNDVLPYAHLDEVRERWRPRLHGLALDLAGDAQTAEEAAQAINEGLWRTVGVAYSTQRERANQGPLQTIESGIASCTGLSILLANACRSIGIPARVVGIASWPGRGGNHAWVEIHDGTEWRFTGAAEHDRRGLDRVWFLDWLVGAVPDHERYGVWASSWAETGRHYPLVWNFGDRTVPAIDTTTRYLRAAESRTPRELLALRLWESRGARRIAAPVVLAAAGIEHASLTFADPDDINRAAEFPLPSEWPARAEFEFDGEARFAWINEPAANARLVDLYWDELGMSRHAAGEAARRLWDDHADGVRAERAEQLEALVLRDGEDELHLLRRDFGDEPASGRSLWISMHGGGRAPASVNDQQWENQIRLYEPAEGIVVAPRAPGNTWDLWHRPEVDRLFDRLIESAFIAWGVDPNRVFLLGYSAGGDGVYQLAPRMADRFAAASMMAGHPNDSDPLGLRNLPFGLLMGADDSAFDRNAVAEQWRDKLAALREADPDGYEAFVRIYPETGHWMRGMDAEAVPWMESFTRDPWPRRIVWRQGNTPHQRFYWLAVDAADAVRARVVRAEVEAQEIRIEAEETPRVRLMLSDALVDLDEPIRVVANGQVVFEGHAARTEAAIRASLAARPDPAMIATAVLEVDIPLD